MRMHTQGSAGRRGDAAANRRAQRTADEDAERAAGERQRLLEHAF